MYKWNHIQHLVTNNANTFQMDVIYSQHIRHHPLTIRIQFITNPHFRTKYNPITYCHLAQLEISIWHLRKKIQFQFMSIGRYVSG